MFDPRDSVSAFLLSTENRWICKKDHIAVSGGCDPGGDITDVYCVGLSSVLKFSLPAWGEDGPVVQVEMVCCIRRVTQ